MLSDRRHYRLAQLAAFLLALVLGCQHTDPPATELAPKRELLQPPPSAPPPEEVVPALLLGQSSVNDPELPQRPITLAECLALALENGRTGLFYDGPGSLQRTSVTSLTENRAPATATDSIRVFAYDPAILATSIEESLARFDVWNETNLLWNRIDQPNRFLTPLSEFDQVLNRNKLDDYNLSTGLYRRLPAGGFAGVRMRAGIEYNYLTASSGQGVVNPAFRPLVDFLFEQPLLQGAGVYINQVRDYHPQSLRHPLPDNGKPPGILLARVTQEQQRLEFERQVHELVYRVEEAYWQLYAAYWDFHSVDKSMQQAHAAWQVAKARFDANLIGIEDLAMFEEQYQFFRQQRLQSLGRGQPGRPGILEAERRLRYITGLPAHDGMRLMPTDTPDLITYEPELTFCVTEAQLYRPELRQVEAEIRAAYMNIDKAKDRLKPDLRFIGRYGMNSLADNLGQSLANVATGPSSEWELGIRLQYQLGFRAGHAETTRAYLQLTQRLAFMKDQQEKLLFSLQRSYQELIQYQEQHKVRVRQREVAELQVKARLAKFEAGGDPKQPNLNDLLLRAQRNWADALREENIAMTNYRIAITDLERQKGTILRHANVVISEAHLPDAFLSPDASRFLRHHGANRRTVGTSLADNTPPPVRFGAPTVSASAANEPEH